ncbi:putative cupin superfamily sugar epimerase [Bradyrhizobium sp. USDA 4350]
MDARIRPRSTSCSRAASARTGTASTLSRCGTITRGAPLTLEIAQDGGLPHAITLGPDVANGEQPQAVVPAGAWQAAASGGDWTLVGCTVAPGFEFAKFEMAKPDWFPGN